MTDTGQSDAAAERSANTPARGGAPVLEKKPPAYVVEVLDASGQVVRAWQTHLDAPPAGFTARIRPR